MPQILVCVKGIISGKLVSADPEFRPGDRVRLKIGGPVLTVLQVVNSKLQHMVLCGWGLGLQASTVKLNPALLEHVDCREVDDAHMTNTEIDAICCRFADLESTGLHFTTTGAESPTPTYPPVSTDWAAAGQLMKALDGKGWDIEMMMDCGYFTFSVAERGGRDIARATEESGPHGSRARRCRVGGII